MNHRRVIELLNAALDLEESMRRDFLARECAGNLELRAEVESLLAESDWVGPYRVLHELGRGGMGAVYLAEQREPIERRIALKVIHGFSGERGGGEKGSRRFAAECRALARLKHPNIAAIYDAGVTDDGQAFVAMEWVEGSHITQWCDERRLSIQDRIELFLGVCAGVSHAHQKGLVHRDLKPSGDRGPMDPLAPSRRSGGPFGTVPPPLRSHPAATPAARASRPRDGPGRSRAGPGPSTGRGPKGLAHLALLR